MQKKSIALAALLALAALGFSNCKNATQNSNQQTQTLSASKARWVAKFRSPSSRAATGVGLATFMYSSISMVSPLVIFAAGDMPHPAKPGGERVGVVVRTTDGGGSWKEFLIEHPEATIPVLNAIHFVSPTVGWIAGADAGRSGVVLKTTDGGESWAFTRLPFKQIPTSLFFVDEQTGWMGGVSASNDDEESEKPAAKQKSRGSKANPTSGVEEESEGGASDLLFTDDGGRTWRSQRRLSVSIVDIFFLDRMNGWIAGYNGSIYRTTDGGRSWDAQKSELETPADIPNLPQFDSARYIIQGVSFFDAQNGFAAAANLDGEAGRALGTSNGGAVWSQKWIVPDSGVKDVAMISPSEAWAIVHANNGYVYRTVDAGRSWLAEPVEFEQTPPLFKLAAKGSDVWLAGGGAIFKRVE
jgi:photosystem II stability/assembly factor-like uncharacterized protein